MEKCTAVPATFSATGDYQMTFYDLMLNQCQPAAAIERYAGDGYIQHNPAVADPPPKDSAIIA